MRVRSGSHGHFRKYSYRGRQRDCAGDNSATSFRQPYTCAGARRTLSYATRVRLRPSIPARILVAALAALLFAIVAGGTTAWAAEQPIEDQAEAAAAAEAERRARQRAAAERKRRAAREAESDRGGDSGGLSRAWDDAVAEAERTDLRELVSSRAAALVIGLTWLYVMYRRSRWRRAGGWRRPLG